MDARHDEGFARTAKDLTAGTVGGIAQVLTGQPFDTIKVRLQAQAVPPPGQPPQYSGMLGCARKTAAEGLGAFYKGTTTPLLGVGLCVSIQFGVLEFMKRHFTHTNALRKDSAAGAGLTLPQLFISGAVAGVANSFVAGPVEHIRTRLQVQSATAIGGALPYAGPLDLASKVYSAHGIPGIYKGQGVTMLREFGGFGMYFMVYEHLIQRDMAHLRKPREKLETWRVCMNGAVAGYSLWLTIFPLDVIKSKLQTDGFTSSDRKYRSMMDCARKIYSSEGVTGFFRGLAPCMLRAAPANAATFLCFEMAMRLLNRM